MFYSLIKLCCPFFRDLAYFDLQKYLEIAMLVDFDLNSPNTSILIFVKKTLYIVHQPKHCIPHKNFDLNSQKPFKMVLFLRILPVLFHPFAKQVDSN